MLATLVTPSTFLDVPAVTTRCAVLCCCATDHNKYTAVFKGMPQPDWLFGCRTLALLMALWECPPCGPSVRRLLMSS